MIFILLALHNSQGHEDLHLCEGKVRRRYSQINYEKRPQQQRSSQVVLKGGPVVLLLVSFHMYT